MLSFDLFAYHVCSFPRLMNNTVAIEFSFAISQCRKTYTVVNHQRRSHASAECTGGFRPAGCQFKLSLRVGLSKTSQLNSGSRIRLPREVECDKKVAL